MNIETVKSAGGIEAWLVEDHTSPMLALRFAFEGGSAQDPAEKEGAANFVAQMRGEGAGELDAIAFQDRVKDLALHLNFSARRDHVSGSLDVLSEWRAEALQLVKLALTAPRFDADAVGRIRQRLRLEIARSLREPNKVASWDWDAAAFAGHTYARPVLGTEASVAKITADDLEFYGRRVFARDVLKVVAVGDITAIELATMLDEVFGALPAESSLTLVPQVGSLPAGRLAVVEMDVPQSAVAFGMAGIDRHDADYMAAVVLNHIVGGGSFTSRLMEEVRVKRGLAYGVSTTLESSRYASVIKGRVATRNEFVGQSLDVIRAELQRAADGDISEHELESVKSYLIGSWPLRFSSSTNIAAQLMSLRLDGHGPDYVTQRNERIAAVRLDDVKRAAHRLLNPSNLIVTVVGRPVLPQSRGGNVEVSAA